MALKIFIITLAILVICSAVYADVTDAQVEQAKADIEQTIKQSDITCENVDAKCQKLGEMDTPIKVCLTLIKPYVCENRQSLADVKEAMIKVEELVNELIG